MFSTANQEIQQLVYVISREQHIISYEIFAAKGQWKDLKEADEQNSNDREVDGKQEIEKQSEGPGTEGNSFVNSEDWARKLEGGHGIDDVTLGACLGTLRLYHLF